ncbi:uncharacterized protein N7446_002367 [Penicillium canescens]|uniref:Bacteriophage T5 Orf172 DNA-binding domain-containing protein n=1 Tax=Penicillium canescens TaxID=5083 RepID=A0AAD6N9U3_PENCN|nr:uncharacterized protein N7446_002367 [Penicillium canescens]KAJ6044171.1 hypothetical protein N7460_005526 [Penicillium canescens]KAJ6055641.1 hypothetical protein N7444_004739 [Penicillium canescens]KAJ6074590.1 hypothetical protein N7446_002367 [Penicillium canescens]
MSSSMETPVNTFIYLSGLLEIIYKQASTFSCAQLESNAEPCGNNLKGSLDLVAESFGQLFAIINDPCRVFHDEDGAFDTVLTQFIQSCLCRSQHQKNADHAMSQWKKELYNRDIRCRLRLELEEYLSKRLEESITSTPLSSTRFKLRVSKTPARTDEDVARKVVKKAREPLSELDKNPGRLYLISLPGLADMFKLGFTAGAKARFSDHRRCYGNITIVKNAFLPYARRIEQLILAELSRQHYMLTEKCETCHRTHKEWLLIGKDDMVNVFDKWVAFARGENEYAPGENEPYDKNGNFNSKDVVLPPPAGDFKFPPSPSSKKSSRRSNGASSQDSPSKPGPARSDSSVLVEGISRLSLGDSQSLPDEGDDDSDSHPISSLPARLAAARMK